MKAFVNATPNAYAAALLSEAAAELLCARRANATACEADATCAWDAAAAVPVCLPAAGFAANVSSSSICPGSLAEAYVPCIKVCTWRRVCVCGCVYVGRVLLRHQQGSPPSHHASHSPHTCLASLQLCMPRFTITRG